MRPLQEALGCTKCSLCRTRNKVVISRGNPKAKIMVVGEAPGEEEDKTGLPFIGRSGQLLDNMLKYVGIDSNRDCYICNIVKCRPPDNRTPSAEEIEKCMPYIWSQIYTVDPKIVLCLGATAAKVLMALPVPISTGRGVWHVIGERHHLATFHPSYLLKSPGYAVGSPRWKAAKDMKYLKERCEELGIPTGGTTKPLNYKMEINV